MCALPQPMPVAHCASPVLTSATGAMLTPAWNASHPTTYTCRRVCCSALLFSSKMPHTACLVLSFAHRIALTAPLIMCATNVMLLTTCCRIYAILPALPTICPTMSNIPAYFLYLRKKLAIFHSLSWSLPSSCWSCWESLRNLRGGRWSWATS